MKKQLLYVLFAFLALQACDDESDFPSPVSGEDSVFFFVDGAGELVVQEGSVNVPLVVSKNTPDVNELHIDYTIEEVSATEGVDFDIITQQGVVTIPSGQASSVILFNISDNDVEGEDNKIFRIHLEAPTGYILDSDPNRFSTATVIIVDNDCGLGFPSGTYSVSTTSSNRGTDDSDLSPYSADISFMKDLCEGNIVTYSVSDITFGSYEVFYSNGAPNPGLITLNIDTNEINMDPADNPDVVYGGDAFSGTGTYNPATNTADISWSNNFGDAGEVTVIF